MSIGQMFLAGLIGLVGTLIYAAVITTSTVLTTVLAIDAASVLLLGIVAVVETWDQW